MKHLGRKKEKEIFVISEQRLYKNEYLNLKKE